MIYRESRWTKPSDWCPKPACWSSTDPQSTEIEVSELVGAFVRALQPRYVVETGTCLGQTAYAIGLALQANEHGTLDTLETSGERADYSRKRCEGLPVTVFQTESLIFEPDEPVDFAWLDSRLELRVPEFERYRPWMNNRTVVGFHDTAPHQAGTLGEDIFSIPGTRAIRLHTPRGVTFLEVL
jgi:predicted O-methyltransferase YrrM